jgi:hypothetical protein
MLLPLLSVGVSITAGLLGGYLMSLALQFQLHSMAVAAIMAAGLHGGVPPAVLLARWEAWAVELQGPRVESAADQVWAAPGAVGQVAEYPSAVLFSRVVNELVPPAMLLQRKWSAAREEVLA